MQLFSAVTKCNYVKKCFLQVNIHDHYFETLEDLGFHCKNTKSSSVSQKNNLIICDKKNMPPKKVEVSYFCL